MQITRFFVTMCFSARSPQENKLIFQFDEAKKGKFGFSFQTTRFSIMVKTIASPAFENFRTMFYLIFLLGFNPANALEEGKVVIITCRIVKVKLVILQMKYNDLML